MTSSTAKWMNALSDDSAGLNTNAGCVALADIDSDGDTKLVIADLGTSRLVKTWNFFLQG